MGVTACTIETTRSQTNRRGTQVIVTYNIKADEYVLAHRAEIQARGSTPDPLPIPGRSLSITTVSNNEPDLIADTIEVVAKDGTNRSFVGRVTFIPASQSFSRPLVDSPEKIPPIYWTEALTETKFRDFGKNKSVIRYPWINPATNAPQLRPKGTLGAITNAAGFRYGNRESLQKRIPVFVKEQNVLSPFTFIPVHLEFENTVNQSDYNLFGLGLTAPTKATGTNLIIPKTRGFQVKAETVMFWYQTVDGPHFFGENQQYWKLQTRLVYNPKGHNVFVRNEGDKVWVLDSVDKTFVLETPNRSGLPLPPPVQLSSLGELRESTEQIVDELEFEDLTRKDFNILNTKLANL